jgi:hypothetical protein
LQGFWICPSFKDPFLSRRAKPQLISRFATFSSQYGAEQQAEQQAAQAEAAEAADADGHGLEAEVLQEVPSWLKLKELATLVDSPLINITQRWQVREHEHTGRRSLMRTAVFLSVTGVS